MLLWPIAAATLLVVCAAAPASLATSPISRLDTPWWRARFVAKQAELGSRHVELLWLGDSITQDWEKSGPGTWQDFAPAWQHFYGDRHAVNLGFRGDSTCHLLWRLLHGELDGLNPRAAILLIGANNFGHIHMNAGQTFNGIAAILTLLHQRLPHTSVLLLGVLPSIRSAWVDSNTRRLNQRLALLPARDGSWLRYINVGAVLERNGRVDAARFLDTHLVPPDPPLHPDATSQRQIAGIIEPAVAAMMGDYDHRHGWH